MWFFSIWICFSKVVQKSDRYWVLVQVGIASMLSKSEKILMSLNSKQKSLCQLATTELFPKETKNRETARKWQKHVWVISNSNFMQPRGALFLSLMVTNCSGKRFFSRCKRIKNELNSRNVPGEVVQSDTRRQAICNEFLDNFVMKKARTKPFNCLLCYVQPYLIRW